MKMNQGSVIDLNENSIFPKQIENPAQVAVTHGAFVDQVCIVSAVRKERDRLIHIASRVLLHRLDEESTLGTVAQLRVDVVVALLPDNQLPVTVLELIKYKVSSKTPFHDSIFSGFFRTSFKIANTLFGNV